MAELKEGEAMEALEAAQAPAQFMSDAEKQAAEHARMEGLRAAQVAYDQKIHGAGVHPDSWLSGAMPQSVKELHEKVVAPLHDRLKALEEVIGKLLGRVE